VVTVSVAAVATAAHEVVRPLDVVRPGRGQRHAGVVELRLRPVGIDQHFSRAHG
jgi:hypothetical protein